MSSTPQTIGKYKILGVLGKGAMGLVYRAEDPLLQRQVALKVITGDEVSEEMKTRFQVEARAAAALDHPNIVTIFDLGEHEGQPYIAMELLKGEDLRQVMHRKPNMPVREAAEIICQVAEGLSYAHERKIVHRDIKPANITILSSGRAKVVDFGVAKMESTSLTKTGMVIGTPDYMSPEQIQGKAVDTRSDIFSLGVVFYEMLTRNKPFRAESITSVIYNIVFKEPPTFQSLGLEVPQEVQRIIAKAMAKDVKDRYQNIGDMAADLRRWLTGGSTQTVATSTPSAPTDATTALSNEEIMAATRVPGTVGGTLQVGESPTMRDRAAAEAPTQLAGGTQRAAAPARRRPLLLVAGAAVLVVAVLVAWLALKGGEEAPAPAVAVQVLVSPWATMERLERLEGQSATAVTVTEATTPARLSLPPGRYRATFSNSALGVAQDSHEFTVGESGAQVVQYVLRGFNPAQAAAAPVVLAP